MTKKELTVFDNNILKIDFQFWKVDLWKVDSRISVLWKPICQEKNEKRKQIQLDRFWIRLISQN